MNVITLGDCRKVLKEMHTEIVDLVYLDPPFFTQKEHSLTTRDNLNQYSFNDKFSSIDEYLNVIEESLSEIKRVLKSTGSIFLHCDKNASHHLRLLLDKVFGQKNFRSEIIWSYKRWSNSKKGLLNAHQSIYFYSKSADFKFNSVYTSYSPTTNIDQILQERERDQNGKSIYKRDSSGQAVLGKEKKGVPLSDVWEIPYLNPKAKERSGYPTQKPVLLLEQVIKLVTNEGDVVLDPFCGSGTTCVAAKSLNRMFIGIDISQSAVALAKSRINEMVITKSNLLEKGIDKYLGKSNYEMEILNSINAVPVQRNTGIDGFLKDYFIGCPVPVRIQKNNETVECAIEKLEKSTYGKKYALKLVIQTKDFYDNRILPKYTDVKIIKTLDLQIVHLNKSLYAQDSGNLSSPSVDSLHCDIITGSETILSRVEQIEVSIKNVTYGLERLVSQYDGDIHSMSDLDIAQYNEFQTQLDNLRNECIELLGKNDVDSCYLNVGDEINNMTKNDA